MNRLEIENERLRNALTQISNMSIMTEQGLKDERDEGSMYGTLSKEYCLRLLSAMRGEALKAINADSSNTKTKPKAY